MKLLFSAVFLVFGAQVSAIWPRGQYCLPMPSNQRCPIGWDDGYRFQTTEGNNTVRGDVPYVATRGEDLGWGFCCKTRVRYSRGRSWPRGSYCIFRKGGFCPRGFMEGMFYWNVFLAGLSLREALCILLQVFNRKWSAVNCTYRWTIIEVSVHVLLDSCLSLCPILALQDFLYLLASTIALPLGQAMSWLSSKETLGNTMLKIPCAGRPMAMSTEDE